jgi:pimeloyl-ACP methyl ester carboxylesterase
MDAPANGTTLRYELAGGGEPAIVLTHGLGSDLAFWDPVVEPLAAHHRVLRWDLRGSGASATPPGPYDAALFARDLAALLDHVGIHEAHFVGHSGGGVVTQRFALDFPERVRSLVLASTSSEVGEKASAAWARLADSVERQGFPPRATVSRGDPVGPDRQPSTRGFAPAFAAAHPEIVREIGERTRRNDPAAYAATARAFGSYRFTEELRRMQAPTLVLQGLDDALTPPGGSVILARALPRSRLVMVPGAGHYLPIEMPALFTTGVLAFVAGREL